MDENESNPWYITRRRRTPVDPARPFAELDWSSSANGRAESVLGPARPFAELGWSSLANGRAESVLGPARPFAELDWSSSVNCRAESVFDDQVCLFRRTDPLDSRCQPSMMSTRRLKLGRGAEAVPNHDPLVDGHRRLIGEVFFLRSLVQNMMAHRDLLIQQVKASARWELMKEWLEKRVEHWDPEEEYRRHLLLSGGIDQQSGSFSRVSAPRSVVGSRFSEDPSKMALFSPLWIFSACFSGGRSSMDVGVAPDLEITQGPEGSLGTRKLRLGSERWALNPEVSGFLEYRLLESGDWEPGGFSLDPGIMTGARRLYEDPKISSLDPDRTWNPEASHGVYLLYKIIFRTLRPYRNPRVLPQILRSLRGTRRLSGNPENPEYLFFAGTVLRLPRQDCYQYLFGFRILPLGSWPLSISYDVFNFCKKSLTGLEGAGLGVMTQVPGFDAFHIWINRDYEGPRCALGCTGVLGSFDSILRLAHTHSCSMSHTRFDFLWACHFMTRVSQDQRTPSSYFLRRFFPRNMVRLSVSAIYDEHQKAKTRKRRPFHTPPPRLARAASSVNGLSSTSSVPNHDPLVDAHQRLVGEVFFLHSQVEDMMARRDLLVQQVRASARWELMKEWLEKRVEHWDPEEEYRRHLFLSRGIDQQSGTSPLSPPQDLLWGRDSRRSLLYE
ncbi:hypothetical protein DY000_02014520 [Brassica cretica]|uniref:Aminotransferase-like plant mobile domain-containing protein n=1 Tax=Brassica cretica TaxID=69181 RepID=A0ABQ7CWS9_BRACR|nr:hypothetical protein DY000_02014520 [Brassica cretica]